MQTNLAVADMQPGLEFKGYYLISAASVRTTTSGKAYLSANLSDATGSVEAKQWDYTGSFDETKNGTVVQVQGRVTEFKGSSQVNIDRMRFANDNDAGLYQIEDLVPSAPIDADLEMQDIRYLVSTIADADYRRLCEVMLQRHADTFQSIPAAKSMHHSFLHGLLMHTSNMLHLADYLSGQYSEVINRSLLLTGTLLHDFAKEKEFTFSKLGLVTDYSIKGQLLGHLVMGAQEAAQVCTELGISEQKSILLQHLLLSHHGVPEYGACVLPSCAEAELLSYIDMIDSRMEIYAEQYATLPEGKVSQRIPALEKRIYHHTLHEEPAAEPMIE
ncbi:MAG: OB-fold nucleic acid binding domain-containing protein [Oscillospiraceae bacterium]|nr:OB-fold nucleic acid binding domain-containing protein [Oscillospiraceae bacterium]